MTKNQQWLHYYNQTALSAKWSLFFDAGYRWENVFQESAQYIARAAIGYTIRPEVRISSGLAHFGFYSSAKIGKVEWRPYQEIVFSTKFHTIGLSHRYRLEERFFKAVDDGKIQTPNTFNFRFRYAVMVNIPLFKLSKEKKDKIFLITLGDELFINAGKGNVHSIFDQNRIIVSPTFQLSEQLALSVTWNSQFAASSTQANYVHTNVVWLQIRHKFDLKPKTEGSTSTMSQQKLRRHTG